MTLSHNLHYRSPSDVLGVDNPTISPQNWYARRGKRLLDLVVAMVLAVALLPVLLGGMAVVALSIGRPIFFKQDRIGRNGELFQIWKLRTLRSRTSKHGDVTSRCTPATRWLRRASIDEIPQLWNIIRGDMSLVGPRPEIAALAEQEDLVQHPRHLVRPGLTGAWQVSDARRFDISEGAELDVSYVSDVSLRGDLRILFQTPRAVLACHTE